MTVRDMNKENPLLGKSIETVAKWLEEFRDKKVEKRLEEASEVGSDA